MTATMNQFSFVTNIHIKTHMASSHMKTVVHLNLPFTHTSGTSLSQALTLQNEWDSCFPFKSTSETIDLTRYQTLVGSVFLRTHSRNPIGH